MWRGGTRHVRAEQAATTLNLLAQRLGGERLQLPAAIGAIRATSQVAACPVLRYEQIRRLL